MRFRSASILALVLATVVGLVGCGGGSKKRGGASTAAAVTSGTTGGTQSGSTTATTTSSSTSTPATSSTTAPGLQPGGGVATTTGGNTSSGSSGTGATPAGFFGGSGRFVDASARLPNSTSTDYGADAADLDGDGDVDVAIAVNGAASRILWNEPTGFVLRPNSLPATVMRATDVRAVDVDGDRDLDLLFCANFEPVRVFLNNGQGVFTLGSTFDDPNDAYTYNIALGDADKDGDQDAFLTRAGQNTPSKGQERLYLNDGRGRFTLAPAGTLPTTTNDSMDATFFDVDKDGDLDIFVANFGTPHDVLINDGTGKFANRPDAWLPATLTRYGTAIAQGDLTRDGKIDLFICNEGPSVNGAPPAGEKNTFLIQGSPKFDDSPARVPSEAEASFAVRLIDVNGDGWQDVIVSNLRAIQRLYLNQQGTLVDATANFPAVNQVPSDSLGLTIGDFDSNRTPDVLFVRRGAKPFLFLNQP